MKQTTLIITLFMLLIPPLSAQSAVSVSQQLYSFSPLARIILKHLSLEDKNHNGVIDKGANEGYEPFIEKYGNADIGFPANGITNGTNNARLEEPEIVNHYYTAIRFKPDFSKETTSIESEVTAYIYANNIPLVWLDDEQGTVMNAVNQILGIGWNEQKVSEDKAVEMFNRALMGLGISGRPGVPSQNGGYYTLPELVNRKYSYCTEAAQFGFWFFSELKINATSAWTVLPSSVSHEVLKLNPGKVVDYFGNNRYNISKDNWHRINPFQSLGAYYLVKGQMLGDKTMLEQAVLYDKYSIDGIYMLMFFYFHRVISDYTSIIDLGDFFINNNDIDKILNKKSTSLIKEQTRDILAMLLQSCYYSKNKLMYDKAVTLLKKHYAKDTEVNNVLKGYKLY